MIDNAASMRQYSSDIREIVALLGYVLKDSDPNSISICFTRSSDKITSGKNTKDLLKALGTAQYTGTSNMEATLSTILHKYKACFGTEITKINHLFKKPKSRPLNLYVLTDGIWQPKCDVAFVIQSLVERVRRYYLPGHRVCIQFIRFGNDEDCEMKLQNLDSGLKLSLYVQIHSKPVNRPLTI